MIVARQEFSFFHKTLGPGGEKGRGMGAGPEVNPPLSARRPASKPPVAGVFCERGSVQSSWQQALEVCCALEAESMGAD